MREIKFRGKSIDGKWVFGFLVDEQTIKTKAAPKRYEQVCIYGQYTGSKDYYGNEIYEGDILYNQDSPEDYAYREVVFQRGGFCLRNWFATTPIANHDIKAWEVVGNFYDNPELFDIVNGKKKGGAQ